MTIIFIIIGIIVFIIGSFLLIALIAKKEYTIQRDINIGRPLPEVFTYIRSVKNHDKYNKWWMMDPDAKKEYKGVDGTVGFIAGWNSKNNQAGEGEQEIKRIIEGQQVDCEIRFVRPFAGVSTTSMITTANGDKQTNVQWIFQGKHKFPFNAMFAIFGLEKVLGKDLMQSLENLKREVEK